MVTRKAVPPRVDLPSTNGSNLPYSFSPHRAQQKVEMGVGVTEYPRNTTYDQRSPRAPSVSETSDGWVDAAAEHGNMATAAGDLEQNDEQQSPALLPACANLVHREGTSLPHTNPFHRARSSEEPVSTIQQKFQENSADIWADPVAAPSPARAAPLSPVDAFDGLHVTHPPVYQAETVDAGSISALVNGLEAALVVSADARQNRQELQQNPWAPSPSEAARDNASAVLGQEASHRDAESAAQKSEPIANVKGDASLNASAAQSPALYENGLDAQSTLESAAQDTLRGHQVESSPAAAKKQRNETYQIKHVRWLDHASSSGVIRASPILVQNANGPCPLLALVNALTLSTPAGFDTALVETLRVREQVSLGLLLDAVFEELMSGRRGDAANQLPDVGELYSFLVTLHTGMNVNPRFVPSISGQPNPTSSRNARSSGTFEDTREMKLYRTFSIPLIHGWLPPRNHHAYGALQRSAATYEDAQILMSRQEELEDKLQRDGLNQEEKLLLEDIASIKYFLTSSATQLTGYGLDAIIDTLLPGSIAILFRNDHFSTLFKHPQTGLLLSLVTDMGYATHDEIVWESLVDVRGEGCEFYSGDFRPVGHSADNRQNDLSHDSNTNEWTTVTRTSRNAQPSTASSSRQRFNTPPSNPHFSEPSTTEQEDADLALAMQLQEEEEDRSRRESTARRQREEESASMSYINSSNIPHSPQADLQQAQRQRPPQSSAQLQRRNPSNQSNPLGNSQGMRPLVPPPTTTRTTVHREGDDGDDDAPPTYEQAARSSPYHGPVDHNGDPSSIPSSPIPSQNSQSRQDLWMRQNSAYHDASLHALGGMGAAAPGTAIPARGRRKSSQDCVVM